MVIPKPAGSGHRAHRQRKLSTRARGQCHAVQNSPSTPLLTACAGQNSPCSPKMAQFGAFCPHMANFLPLSPPTSHAGRTFSRSHPPPDPAGRTFSRTGRTEVVTVKPTTPLQPLIQASVKPPSPLRTPEQHPLKPTTPMQPKNAPKTPNSHPQRRCRFQLKLGLHPQRRCRFHLKLGLCPQRRWRFHAHVGTHEHRRQRFQTSGPPGRQGQTAVPVVGGRAWPDNEPTRQATRQHTTPHRCGGRRRNRRARASCKTRGLAAVPVGGGRARAGLEIDHSEPSGSRVAISRAGRRPPTHTAARPIKASHTAPETPAGRRAAAHRHTQRPGPSRQATRQPKIYRGNEQREAARPHRDQAAHASGDSCQKPRISQRSRWRRRGRLRR